VAFRLRNVPLLSRIGADRADELRTDIDAATAGWSEAALLRVDHRNQVLIAGARWKPPTIPMPTPRFWTCAAPVTSSTMSAPNWWLRRPRC